ncbi:nitrous oxide reductase family maturation protein NosD [Pontibacter actiniarum]|uniref:nitrous oxide reductase family maturation protein NosD n=1 Tax=Pontibacter actiniarum TaxID=323450 RepID=UPI000409BDF6|nr:nitrous oxide reductase family maturation protein NosD [Pontibacter actiniarum]
MKSLYKYFFASIAVLFVLIQQVQAATLKVCASCPNTSIKKAIALAKPGDKVVVDGGIYREGTIDITKSIHLIGLNNPVLDGQHKGEILNIRANYVTVQGFTLKDVEVSYLSDFAAIRVAEASHVKVLNNKVQNAFFGIYLQRADSCEVRGNVVQGKATTESGSGNAIHLWYCNTIKVHDNKVSGHRDGIYFEFATNSDIQRNLSQGNLRYGLHFMFSDGNVYKYNTFRQNGAGVAVMYTKNIVMQQNLFEGNWGAAAYGLLLKDISRSSISNNTFRRNTTGIYLEGSSKLDVKQNSFENNGWAMRLLSNCEQDTFLLNNFIGNTFDVATNGTAAQNHFAGNYWDKYTGYDLNKDKTGDVPYRPVSLYSMLVERVPPSVMFMRSFIVDLMDQVERVLPSFIPEQLLDNSPSMKKI